jgi:D-apiose dehydrogenase
MADPRFAVFGAGFWARYQLAAWGEVPGATCAAIYNRTRQKADRLAGQFAIPAVYDDPEALLDEVRPGLKSSW